MSFGKVLGNPLVLGIGAGLGLLVLLSRSSGAVPATQLGGYSNAITSEVVALNTAALGAQNEQLRTHTELAKVAFAADVAKQAGVLGYLRNIDDNHTRLALESMSTEAGITNTILVQSNMLTMDILNNNNRLSLGAQEVTKTRITSDASVKIASYQAAGQKVAAIAGAIGNIAGTALRATGG